MSVRSLLTRRRFLRLLGTAAGVGIALPVQARFLEPYLLDITRHTVFLPDLPPECEGMTVAHLTDLHRGPITPDEVIRQATAATKALQPDVVMLTGDFVHSHHRDAAPLAEMLTELRPRLGLWGCLGNHDYGSSSQKLTAALAEGRVRMLRNTAAEITPGLWVAGVDDYQRGQPDPEAAMAPIPKGAAVIYLTHNPIGVFACDRHAWLALAGHTHGGQIRIPGVTPRFPPGMKGFPYIAGWGVFDRARLYINRGVGMGMVPLRLNCRPEVALFTLRRGDALPVPAPGLVVRAFHGARRAAGKVRATARRAKQALRRAD